MVISAVGMSVPSIFLYSKISTDPGLLKIRHSHRFVAVVIQFFNSICHTHLTCVTSGSTLELIEVTRSFKADR